MDDFRGIYKNNSDIKEGYLKAPSAEFAVLNTQMISLIAIRN